MCGAAGAPPITRNTAPGLAAASLKGQCPRCGTPSLFSGPVALADTCRHCGLDLSGFNVGDGPAAFLILIIGTIVAVGAIWMELAIEPAWYAHLVWVPILLGLTLYGLRLGKAALLYQEYQHEAREGRLKE
ncbi:DUF983 domain-containing protein [Sphingomicrobium sediminis]|uniref:DUF983 domain-containing protein n=1 Tax=Sphingomicrobium sediminis TaxID=2950949 RepID=A0A9X2J4E5_9SPHN|nr:DUF983 domain-containing protein [Sphingomicrobium sediminis]MCM8558281.1 DUF983 domain-containing protein [Sphingomicrobium sediminis]